MEHSKYYAEIKNKPSIKYYSLYKTKHKSDKYKHLGILGRIYETLPQKQQI
tara:strand:+ start:917 stop:1069 length:153 start_codon:yes stop_codon:yes gene_type:complete